MLWLVSCSILYIKFLSFKKTSEFKLRSNNLKYKSFGHFFLKKKENFIFLQIFVAWSCLRIKMLLVDTKV